MGGNLDSDLLKLFEEKNTELPEEQFRAELRLRIEKAQTGYSRAYRLLAVLLLAACAALTSFITDSVTVFCMELTHILQYTGRFLATPAGWAVIAAAALISMTFSRRALSMIV
jgi:hypothetical protein